MTDHRTIRRFSSIKDLGPFQKHPPDSDNIEFKQFNLVYGFNGTGKTTLTRIFSSLEDGSLRPELPPNGSFQIELSDGFLVRNDSNLASLKGGLLVFNSDFIDSNFRWKDGKANPIFYLGTEQTKLSQRLETVESELSKVTPKLEQAIRTSTGADKAFTTFKRDAARNIGERINQARGYDASSLSRDYANLELNKGKLLKEKDRQALRQLISADSPPALLEEIPHPSKAIFLAIQAASPILSTTLGDVAISEPKKA